MRNFVMKIKRDYGTSDPFKLAKFMKIEILNCELGEAKGFYKKIIKRKFIFLNKNVQGEARRRVCAHELGHALLHANNKLQLLLDHTSIVRKSILEDEANLFAYYLLYDND